MPEKYCFLSSSFFIIRKPLWFYYAIRAEVTNPWSYEPWWWVQPGPWRVQCTKRLFYNKDEFDNDGYTTNVYIQKVFAPNCLPFWPPSQQSPN